MITGAQCLPDNKTRFTVWAPEKESMLLHIVHPDEQKLAMQKDREGYFSITLENVPAGARYFFMPDGKNDYPDPAAHHQPEDVFGPSEVVDHSIFEWHDDHWHGLPFKDLIFYEMHVGTFSPDGTFEGIIPFLDDLKDTGINALELMPINQFSGRRNWGYDATYPYAVHHSYGGPQGLKKLVDACHQRGIAVFLDVVYNHMGPEGNYLSQYGPYFTNKYCTPWGEALNFDGEWSNGVRDFICENPVYWFKNYHIDGLRLDAVHEIYDKSAISLWEQMHHKVKDAEQQVGRRLYLVAESDLNSPRVTKEVSEGGMNFDAQWLDDFHHILYVFLDPAGKERYADFYQMEQLVKAFKEGFVHSGEWVQFRRRRHGKSSAGVPGSQFIAFNLNHDQVGNRIKGERLSVLISFERQKLATAVLMLSPYIPMLFMGEEYGEDAPFFFFISHHDASNVKAVQEGRRHEFAAFGLKEGENFPDPYEQATFDQCRLQWHKRTEGKYKIMLEWTKNLIQLRKTNGILQNFDKNSVQAYNINQDGLIVIRKDDEGKDFLVCCFNFSDNTLTYTLPQYKPTWQKILDSKETHWMVDEEACPLDREVAGGTAIPLHPCSAVVYTAS